MVPASAPRSVTFRHPRNPDLHVATAVDALARRRAAAVIACAALAFAGSAAVALLVHWPEPVIHDELSQLLAAETFANGRLANPTHSQWQHFESFHIFHEPTYASKYPPASALVMALGEVLASEPLVGVWLGGAAMAGALCWMLYAFVEPRWALFGGLLATLQLGVSSYWTQSYWGGAVPAAAGALVFGAAARLLREPRWRDSFWLGVGLVVLANSRPFEGALIAVAPVAWVGWGLVRGSHDRPAMAATLVPAAAVLLLGAVAMGYYNHVVVGRWWMPPYLHHELLYAERPALAFLSSTPGKQYRHRELRWFYDTRTGNRAARREPQRVPDTAPAGATVAASESGAASVQRAPLADAPSSQHSSAPSDAPSEPQTGFSDVKAVTWLSGLEQARSFLTGRSLLLPLAVGCLLLARPGMGMALSGVGLAVLAVGLSRYFRPHYIAPVAAPLFILIAAGLERLSALRVRGVPVGRALCMLVAAGVILGMLRDPAYDALRRERDGSADFERSHTEVVARLRATPGRDLVVVRYGRHHDLHREWVYNHADIDAADIVWARDMGESGNRELLRYYADRKIWLLRSGYGRTVDGLVAVTDPWAPWPADPKRRRRPEAPPVGQR